MKTFSYTAKKGPTEVKTGTVSAESVDQAIDLINSMGLVPISVDEAVEKFDDLKKVSGAPKTNGQVLRRRVKSRDLVLFYEQLAKLVKSGIPILRGIQITAEQTTNPVFRDILSEIFREVQQGKELSMTFANYSRVFSLFDISMLKAGESAGKLDEALARIALYREEQEEIKSKVRSALAYPAFVMAVGIGTIVFMVSYVIPQFSRFFVDLGQNLPLLTRLLIAFSHWAKMGLPVVASVVVLIVFFLMRLHKTSRGKILFDGLVLRIPLFGSLILKAEIAKISRTLEMLIRSGLPLLTAIRVAVLVLDNEILRGALTRCIQVVEDGGTFSDGLRESKLFPGFMFSLLKVGEESGKLEDAFSDVAEWYERDVGESVKTMTTLLEPLLILVIGLVIGVIVMAVLLPVFSINALAQ